MVKESAGLSSLFSQFIKQRLNGRKRFNLIDLEAFLIEKTGGISAYQSAGGYQRLYQIVKEEENNGQIKALESSPYNGRRPVLRTRWQVIIPAVQGWDDKLIFKLSGQLDLNYYLKRPSLQTEELADRLLRLVIFLSEKGSREWASREERSLELFDNEKYLAGSNGKKLLNRLNIGLADIKAEKYSQMFVYWKKGNRIRKILILENHSAFIACKRTLEAGYKIFSYDIDTLIYGEGKHIIDSLKFLEELFDLSGNSTLTSQYANTGGEGNAKQLSIDDTGDYTADSNIEIKYAGDIDPEGWLIYYRLKERYPEYRLELFTEYYQQMILRKPVKAYPIEKKQQKNKTVYKGILKEFREKGKKKLAAGVEQLWKDNLRLPQELITYEVLKGE